MAFCLVAFCLWPFVRWPFVGEPIKFGMVNYVGRLTLHAIVIEDLPLEEDLTVRAGKKYSLFLNRYLRFLGFIGLRSKPNLEPMTKGLELNHR